MEIISPGCPNIMSSAISCARPVNLGWEGVKSSTRTSGSSGSADGARIGCSTIDDIFLFRESGDAGLGENEKTMSAGAESARRCNDLGFEGEAGKPLNAPRDPDFLCLRDTLGARTRSRSIMDDFGAGIGMSNAPWLGAGEIGRFFEGRLVRAFFVFCKKEDRFLRCMSTGEPGTCFGKAGARSMEGSSGSSSTVFESAVGLDQL